MKFRAIDVIKKQLAFLPLALNTISHETNDLKIKSTCDGFQARIGDFDFVFCLNLCHLVFQKTEILSKELQDPNICSGKGMRLSEFPHSF